MLLTNMDRWRFAGPLIALVAIVFIWLASMLGVFQLSNAWINWQYHYFNPTEREVPQVLLVEAEFDRLKSQEWIELLTRLREYQPLSIVLMRQPAELSEIQLEELRSSGIIISQTAAQASDGKNILTLPPSQNLAELGVHKAVVTNSGQNYISVENAVGSRVLGTAPVEDSFLIDFRPGMNYFPLINAERVLAGDLTDDLINNRVVLIGRGIDPTNPSLLTPLPEEANVSRLMYAGYTVETLLRGKPLQTTNWWLNLLFLLVLLSVSALMHFHLGVRRSMEIAVGGIISLLLVGWFSLFFLDLVLPVAELMAFHLILWYLLSLREQKLESATVRKLLRLNSHRMHDRLLPQDFNLSQDPWGQIIIMTTQVLNLERAILLERQATGKHLHEVKAYGCSINDIDERRRDFERTPYSTAREEGGPILLSKTFLKNPVSDSRQFVVALEFNGQLLGFLCGEVTQESLETNPLFIPMLKDFSNQIGELLHQHQIWKARQRSEASQWQRLLRLDSVESEYRALSEASQLFERRLSLLENVFNSLHTSTILYDLFGQVTHVNRKMEELVKRSGLSVFTMTAADTIATLTGMHLTTAKEHLQHLLMIDEENLTFAVNMPELEGAFSLNVRLLKSEETDVSSRAVKPFRVYGFLLELVDVTHLVRLERFKDDLSNKISAELRNHLEAALLANQLSRQDDVITSEKIEFSELVERKLHQMSNTLSRSQSIINTVHDINRLAKFPVNVTAISEALAKRWQVRLATRDITFNLSPPAFNAFVQVDVTQIENTLDAFVAMLADDSSSGGVIHLSLEEKKEGDIFWTTFILSNSGYGMPEERLKAAIAGSSKVITPALHRLRQARDQIISWSGELNTSTAIGEGIRFEIRLPGFSLDD